MDHEPRLMEDQPSRAMPRDARLSAQRLFAEALQHHQAGRLDDAERLYRQVLSVYPRHADSLHLLGVAATEKGQHAQAVALIGHAIAINPRAAPFHSHLGNALAALDRREEAIAAFRAALRLQPHCVEAQVNLGNTLLAQGKAAEAVTAYGRAIALKPGLAEAHNNMGSALIALGRLDEAVAACLRAVTLQPDSAEVHVTLGHALRAQEQADAAALHFGKALSLKPDCVEACVHLADLLRTQGRWDEAAALCRRALTIAPGFGEAHTTLGAILQEQDRLHEATVCFRKALALRPDDAAAHNNLGVTLQRQGEMEAATACYRRAIAHRPDAADAHLNLAAVLLAHGDMAAGWPEYEWRWQTAQMRQARRPFPQPQWRGEAAGGRTLLIHAEQGFGDTLQFCRYAPLAAARGWRVVLEVQRPLARLLRSLDPAVQVVERGDALPDFDMHCPMLSLPLAFGTTLESIPAADAYLRADPVQAATWQMRLAAMAPRGPRVGLAWAGSPRLHAPSTSATVADRRRSMPPEQLGRLFDVDGVHFFSLQKDGPKPPAAFPLTDAMGEMGDFTDTAALVANLDLVISVDTAVVHLAAALGKQVWLLDRFDPCWRWLTRRRDSPWYPTLRLYRQTLPGDWGPVLDAAVQDLRRVTHAGVEAGWPR